MSNVSGFDCTCMYDYYIISDCLEEVSKERNQMILPIFKTYGAFVPAAIKNRLEKEFDEQKVGLLQ